MLSMAFRSPGMALPPVPAMKVDRTCFAFTFAADTSAHACAHMHTEYAEVQCTGKYFQQLRTPKHLGLNMA